MSAISKKGTPRKAAAPRRGARAAPLNTQAFALELEALWRESGLSRTKYLESIDVPRTTWYDVVDGRHTPGPATICNLALAVGMEPDRAYKLCEIDAATTEFAKALIQRWKASGQRLTVYLSGIGLSRFTWYNLISGKSKPEESTVIKFARATGMPMRTAYRLNGFDPNLAPTDAPQQKAVLGDR